MILATSKKACPECRTGTRADAQGSSFADPCDGKRLAGESGQKHVMLRDLVHLDLGDVALEHMSGPVMIIGTIGLLREPVPFRGEHAVTTNSVKPPPQPADSGEQVDEAEGGNGRTAGALRCSAQRLQGLRPRLDFSVFPSVRSAHRTPDDSRRLLHVQAGCLPEYRELFHDRLSLWVIFSHSVTRTILEQVGKCVPDNHSAS